MIVIFLASCTYAPVVSETSTPGVSYTYPLDLSFDESVNALLVYSYATIRPGAPLPGWSCYFIPKLAIWGDGRVVFSNYSSNERQVRLGHFEKKKLEDILVFLRDKGFFSNWTLQPGNPSGTGFHLEVRLKSKTYAYGWSFPGEPIIFQELLQVIQPDDLPLFIPKQAQLKVSHPPYGDYTAIQWPSQLGFSLDEIGKNGRMVDGEALSFVWQAINNNNNEVTVFKSGNNSYLAWLVIPDISLPFAENACP